MKLRNFILLCCACSWQVNPTHRYKVVYGDGYNVASQQGIVAPTQTSVNDWMYATNNYITFTFDDADHDDTITIYGANSSKINAAYGGIGYCYHPSASSQIYIPDDYSPDVLRRVEEHEIGHALGLKHSGPDTLMYWNLNGAATKITCADVAQLCNVWNAGYADKDKACNPTSMPACENANVVPNGGTTLFCHVGSIYQPCDPSNPYYVQVGTDATVSCEFDPCEYEQTCFLDGQQGICDAEPID